MATRTEHDSLGSVQVDASRYWGAQTQRSVNNFPIGSERLPREMIRALGLVKSACASVNVSLGTLDERRGEAIRRACEEVIDGSLDEHFPVRVWQTGSGTHSNMNANEVIANRAIELLGGARGDRSVVHPNDHVNRSQSSNDVFPTAMHVATYERLEVHLLPRARALRDTLSEKAKAFDSVLKLGRTHLMDATPITLGQEMSGWVAQMDIALHAISGSLPALAQLAQGGTAVGTGLNAPSEFGELVAAKLSELCGHPFRSAPNKFAALAGHEALVQVSASLRTLATALLKIANDVRWLASGPRSGLAELRIPENEPGSSIMPGKVNPTQCEALSMVCVQVMGNDLAVTIAASRGELELNVYKPVIAFNVLGGIRLLGDACASFDERCARGIEPNSERMNQLVSDSLMLVTALAPHVGYDAAALIAHHAHATGSSLRAAALDIGGITAEQYDAWVVPMALAKPERKS